MFAKRVLTIVAILAAWAALTLIGMDVLADIADPRIPYGWITARLALIGVSMLVSPIAISHIIEWLDVHTKGE